MVYKSAKIGKKEIIVSGISKGSGMIAPNMATTLSFLVTNADLSNAELYTYLKTAIDKSLNMVSLDTDTSTNDLVLIFSTGEKKFSKQSKEYCDAFQDLMTDACIDLAKQMARDGEGATKLVEVAVSGAASINDARIVAKNIANSPLVKTAITAASPNWGRIIMAIGKDPNVKVNQKKLDISISDVSLVSMGNIEDFDVNKAIQALESDTVSIQVNLNLGHHEATAWGCDLTHEFIRINAEYN